MAREKIGTSINKSLITHMRVLSRRIGQPLNEIIVEALEPVAPAKAYPQTVILVRKYFLLSGEPHGGRPRGFLQPPCFPGSPSQFVLYELK